MRFTPSSRLRRSLWRRQRNGCHTALCRRFYAFRCGRAEGRLFNPEAVVQAQDGSVSTYKLPEHLQAALFTRAGCTATGKDDSMNRPQLVTSRLANRFEKRTDTGEWCEGCNNTYTRESYSPGLYRCPKCEVYMEVHDWLLHSYGVMLEEWRHKFGLSRKGALQHAREFGGLFDDIQELMMDGYSMRDYEAALEAEVARLGNEAAD